MTVTFQRKRKGGRDSEQVKEEGRDEGGKGGVKERKTCAERNIEGWERHEKETGRDRGKWRVRESEIERGHERDG